MIVGKSSKIISIDKLEIDENDKKQIYIPKGIENTGRIKDIKKNIVKVGNDFYYCKYDNTINELIGSYLAKKLSLDSVNYQIGNYSETLYVISKLFYEERFNYFYANMHKKAMKSNTRFITEIFPDFYQCTDRLNFFDEKTRSKLLKLIAIDLKMGQRDRHGYNLMFKEDLESGIIDLAPIYDYSNSYPITEMPFLYYKNPFILIRNNQLSLRLMIKKYPEIMQYIDFVRNISIEQIMSDIEEEKEIQFESLEKEYRIKVDNEYTKILRNI